MSSAAREEILARIRGALGPDRPRVTQTAVVDAPVEPLHEPREDDVDTDRSRLVERFAERCADYRATVVAVTSADVGVAVAAACERAGVVRLGVPDGLDPAVLPDGARVGGDAGAAGITGVPARPGARDDALAFTQLDALVAQAPLAIAETGTIIFDAGPGQGPRAASLLPDVLIAIVPADVIVDGVEEATRRMAATVRETARPLTLVSGPSATSDIELDRVEGVHGPRTLEVVVVTG